MTFPLPLLLWLIYVCWWYQMSEINQPPTWHLSFAIWPQCFVWMESHLALILQLHEMLYPPFLLIFLPLTIFWTQHLFKPKPESPHLHKSSSVFWDIPSISPTLLVQKNALDCSCQIPHTVCFSNLASLFNKGHSTVGADSMPSHKIYSKWLPINK